MHINNKYEILTPNGFETFDGIQLNEKEEYLDISFINNINIKCSLDHKFIVDNKKIYAKDLSLGDFLEFKNKKIKIQSIKLYNNKINMFDIINSGKDHCFYANDILSSNCDADFASSGNTVLDPETLK